MNKLFLAVAASALLSTGAMAQTNPVPGSQAPESAMPAGAASTVVTPTDAPSATTGAATSDSPVPGNSSGIDSTMPAGAASTVTTTNDAVTVPTDTANPVPGTAAGETSVTPPN